MNTLQLNVFQTFEALEEHNTVVRNQLINNNKRLWLPDNLHDTLPHPKNMAADILTRLYQYEEGEKDCVPTGLWHASPELIQDIHHLNDCKDAFKQAIAAIKKGKEKNNSLKRFLDKSARRDENVKQALQDMRLSEIDLRTCYRHIRVLPEGLQKIQWTLEKRHMRSQPVTRTEVEELIEKMDQHQDIAWALLQSVKDDKFTIAMKTTNRYLANLIWINDEGRHGRMVHTSSIVFTPTLPHTIEWNVYRDKPCKSRSGKRIRDEPLIKALSLYQYETVRS